MELKLVNKDDSITKIALSGKLDLDGEGQIGDEFRRLVKYSDTSFIIDMKEVTFLASLGIRMLFAGAKSLAERGRKMVIFNPAPYVEETLLTSGTAKLILIAKSEEDAVGLVA